MSDHGMTPERRAEFRRLEAAADKAPWITVNGHIENPHGSAVTLFHWPNALLVTAARNALPELLDAFDRAEVERDRWKYDLDSVAQAVYPEKRDRFTYSVDTTVAEINKLRAERADAEQANRVARDLLAQMQARAVQAEAERDAWKQKAEDVRKTALTALEDAAAQRVAKGQAEFQRDAALAKCPNCERKQAFIVGCQQQIGTHDNLNIAINNLLQERDAALAREKGLREALECVINSIHPAARRIAWRAR